MSEHRNKILKMVAEGKISVDEAGRLLDALPETAERVERPSGGAPKFLKIVVESTAEKGAHVNIKVPLRLLHAGMKIANLIPEKSRDKVQKAIDSKGIQFDLATLESLDAEELIETLSELDISAIDDESGERVRIYCQ